MRQISDNIKEKSIIIPEPEEIFGCDNCWGAGWVIEEVNLPFYDLTFENLMIGDTLIRCTRCNGASKTETKKTKKSKR
jgi:hypothetical protein